MQIEHEVRQFIVKSFLYGQDQRLAEDTSLLAEGIVDSTGMLDLIAFLEETCGIRIQDEELVPENLDSIRNIAAFVGRKQQEKAAVAG